MKKSEVRIGETYTVKVSGQLAPVRVTGTSPYGGWIGVNTKTNREVRIRTAARLRGATVCPGGAHKSKDRKEEE